MLKALWRAWVVVARKIGAIQSRIVLVLFYFVLMAPFGLAVRFFTDPLALRRTPSWTPLAAGRLSPATLEGMREQS